LNTRARNALQHATEIVAVSEASKVGAVAAYGIDDRRITVVHHGIDPVFGPRDLGPSEPYVLCVSTHEPRKNLDTLAVAFVDAADASGGRPPPRLVLGGQQSEMTARLRSILGTSRAAESATRMLRSVSDAELVGLYQGAAVVACPSLCEGFGFPIVEALACG